MRRPFFVIVVGLCVACTLAAQDDRGLQVHGFVTQAFVYSSANNYLGMETSSGTTAWTEAALNVNDQVSDKLRVGMQLHFMELGKFGDQGVSVDWALGDYKFDRKLGMRAGVVKIRWGLFNDVQDFDPGYMWSLLPEPIYAVDVRATNLSVLGVEAYGSLPLPKKLGDLEYSVYAGDYYYAPNDGYMEGFTESGLTFSNRPSGKTPGFDLRWKTPVKGLKVGGSLMMYDAQGNLTDGTLRQPLAYWPTVYGEYEARKFFFSGQYMKLGQYTVITVSGTAPSTNLSDTRAWFVMSGYHVTDKLQLGTYYTHYVVASAADQSDPANHFRDWVASSRYDFDSYFYANWRATSSPATESASMGSTILTGSSQTQRCSLPRSASASKQGSGYHHAPRKKRRWDFGWEARS